MRKFINIVESAGRSVSDNAAFKRWFAGSKVIDAHGHPLRVFHGGAPGIKAFDKSKIGQNFGVDDEGFFFTTNTAHHTAWFGGNDRRVYDDMYSAGAYAKNVDGIVYPCYLRIINPLKIEDWAEWHGLDIEDEVAEYGHVQDILDRHKKSIVATAKENGNDGIIASDGRDHVFVVFEPNQIKSAFNTSFSPDSDDIMESTSPYSDRDLEDMDIDDLDWIAYGYVGDQIVELDPRDIEIKWTMDLENPEHKFKLGGMDWVNSVSFDDPVDVSVAQDGTLHLEDGHHRRFAALKRGQKLKARIEIKGNPILRIRELEDEGIPLRDPADRPQ